MIVNDPIMPDDIARPDVMVNDLTRADIIEILDVVSNLEHPSPETLGPQDRPSAALLDDTTANTTTRVTTR